MNPFDNDLSRPIIRPESLSYGVKNYKKGITRVNTLITIITITQGVYMIPIPMTSFSESLLSTTISIKRLATDNSTSSSLVLQYSNGECYGLGTNTNSKFGTGSTSSLSTWVKLMSDVRLFAIGSGFSILITTANKVFYSGSLQGIFNTLLGSILGKNSYPDAQVYTDITASFNSFDISKIKDIQCIDDNISGKRIYVLDGNSTLWGIGDNTNNALGAGVLTTKYSWVQLSTLVKSVHSTLYSTWIMKTDGSLWRCGINTLGTLGGSTKSVLYSTFTRYSDYVVKDISCSSTAVTLLLQDGSIRFLGQSLTGSFGDLSTVSNILLQAYNPGLSSIKLLEGSGSTAESTILVGTSLYASGSNLNNKLGLTGSVSTFTGISSPSILKQDVGYISTVLGLSSASYYVYANEVYACGSGLMTMSTGDRLVWSGMHTPRSVKF